MGYKTFTRKDLYDLLTDKPITSVAKEYGLVYNDLKGVCIGADIPFRSASDWSRINQGEKVSRAPLSGNYHAVVSVRQLGKSSGKATSTSAKSYGRYAKPPEKKKEVRDKNEYRYSPSSGSQHYNDWDSYWIRINKNQPPAEKRKETMPDKKPVVKETVEELDKTTKITTDEITERLKKYPQDATLYQILGIKPFKETYRIIDVSKVTSNVRAINALKRNGIFNLHDLLSLKYSSLLGLRNSGIQTVYTIIKSVLAFFDIQEFPDEIADANADDQVELVSEQKNKEEKNADETKSGPNSEELTVELLVAFNQLNRDGQQTLVDTAKAFSSLDKYKKEEKTVIEYKIITLCGSTRFKDAFLEAQKRLTLEGNIVISVGLFGHSGDEEVWTEGTKEMLDDMHKRKIDMADEIYVINVGGYIGSSTKSEIEYAQATGKSIRYLEKPEGGVG